MFAIQEAVLPRWIEDMIRIYIIPEGIADKGEKPGEEKGEEVKSKGLYANLIAPTL